VQPTGRLLGGRYELTALIATGGMGQVWQARDAVLNRDVAVKVLRSEYTGDPTFLARFRAEAQLAAGLVHPNIATLFDYGEDESDTGEHLAYLVMELVRGESLSALLYREYALSPDRTLDVLRQSAAGLAAAHATGVIHRDVKPGNVLIGVDGTVKITDFGVAVSGSSVPLTQTGQVIGTPHYLSPEQAAGARATPASDVYALGAIGYMCLTGRRVFDAETSLQVMLLQLHGIPDPLPDHVPEAVRQLIETAMVKDPALRFPDGAAFRDAVDDVLAGRPLRRPAPSAATAVFPAATGSTVSDGTEAEPRRRRLLVPLLALLAVAAIVVGAVQLLGPSDDDRAGTASGPTSGTTASATSSPPPSSPAVQLVDVLSATYLNRPVSQVQAELTALGLQVTLRPLTTSDVPDGQVITVDPVGPLAPASPVTVTYATAPVPATTAVPAPVPAPVPNSSTTVGGGAGTGATSGTGGTGGTGTTSSNGNNGNGNGNGKANGKDKAKG
jgi:serine/threonine protein kinase